MASGPPRPRKKRHLDDHPDDQRPASRSIALLSTTTNLQESTEAPGQKHSKFTNMFDRLRSIATCKICFRMLYEPYSLSCGHIYCYSCLCQWFNKGDRKKTCPDCRAIVKTSPAPAYLVREMTQELIQHPEILPEGETKEQHEQWKDEEAEMVERDRLGTNTGSSGLFSGMFKSQTRQRHQPIRDEEDGVWRCPGCNWELEEGGVANCPRCELLLDGDMASSSYSGSDFDNESDVNRLDLLTAQSGTYTSDEESDDVDGEFDMPDAELQFGMEAPGMEDGVDAYYDSDSDNELPGFDVSIEHVRGRGSSEDNGHGQHSYSADGSRYPEYHQRTPSPYPSGDDVASTGDESGEEEEEEDEEYDSALDDFIEDDEGDAADSEGSESESDDSASTQRQSSPDGPQIAQGSVASAVTSTITDASEEESDEGGAVSRGHRRRLALSPRSRTISRRRQSSATTVSADNASGADECEFSEEDEPLGTGDIRRQHPLAEFSLARLGFNSQRGRMLGHAQAYQGMFGKSRNYASAIPALQRRPVNHWTAQHRRQPRIGI